jgi:hypothetical protein
MATACWDFIVAIATRLEPAPTLVISSLRGTNMKIHQQLIHNRLWMCWGQFQQPSLRPSSAGKSGKSGLNYTCREDQSGKLPVDVSARKHR